MGLPVFQPAAILRLRPASSRDPVAPVSTQAAAIMPTLCGESANGRDGSEVPATNWRLAPVMRPGSANQQHIVVNSDIARSIY